MSRFFKFWIRQARARPFVTIAATEGILSIFGDLLAQTISIYKLDKALIKADPDTTGSAKDGVANSAALHQRVGGGGGSSEEKDSEVESYNLMRTARFFTYACLDAPLDVKWHHTLDKYLPFPASSKAAAKSLGQVLPRLRVIGMRVVADQLFYEPIAYMVFFTGMTFLEGGNWDDAKAKVSKAFWPTYLAGMMFWPAVQAVNFAFVPLMFRVPFASMVGIFWDTFLSWVNSKPPPQQKQMQDVATTTTATTT
ncbi:hypothetical protein EV182_005998 [Spiromyces aspiralis]|uniref:Uncharacterized protein n=1 Tax=Spiromyces aspiralis TaxID=68401 RepID=A0ACC1HD65_9FUNG|nr:hypothetical protein EV182_005998 [Spiromyces aspiralis]